VTSQLYSDGTYLAHNPTWHVEDSAWKAAQVIQILGGTRPTTLCEIGCGAGAALDLLSSHFHAEAVGYDISAEAIALAESRARAGLTFRVGQPGPSARYDVTLLLDVVEHVEDPYSFLRALHRLSDYVVCHLPLELSVQAVLRSRFSRSRRELGHLHYFSAETALDLFDDCGFTVQKWKFLAPVLDRGGKSLKAQAAALPRRLLSGVSPKLMSRTFGGASMLLVARTADGR
jgi:SAM-dependent methyltransferase